MSGLTFSEEPNKGVGPSQVALAVKNLPANAGAHKRCGLSLWVAKFPWRRAQQPTPVFLPGESHGQSLASYKIGLTWGLIVKMAHYVNLTKNTITVILEADQIAQMTFCFLTDTYLLKASRPPDSRPPAM